MEFPSRGSMGVGKHTRGRVEATPNFREILRGRGDAKVIKFNLKYKNHKIINPMQNSIAWWP